MACYKGSLNYHFKRRTFHTERSGNRRFWKRYARRIARRGNIGNPGWLNYVINNP